MRLFLSSYGLGNQPDKLVGLLDKNKKVAVVTNASDYHSEAGILERLETERGFFSNLGMQIERLDLRDYFVNHDGLKERLHNYGLIWVRGGNAFVLRRAMAQSGFDEAIVELLRSDRLVYGGYSAGACVLSPSLNGVELCDDPNIVPPGYDREIVWRGLNLVDFSLAPHYQSNHPESASIDRVVEYFQHKNMKYETLKDGEAIVVHDGKQTKLQ